MSEPHRIQGPGSPSEPVQKKDRTVGADDFKKYMVEEIKEIDTEAKGKKRKKREEGEEDTEAEKKAVGAGPATPTLKPMESVEETPLKAKGGSTAIPTSTEAGAPKTTTFAFNPKEIEKYAWEDEAKRTTAQYSPDQQEAYPQSQYRETPRFEGFTAPSVEPQAPQTAPSEGKEERTKEKQTLRPPLQKKPSVPQKKGGKSSMEPSKLLAKEGKHKKGGVEEFKTFMEESKPPPKKTETKETARPPKEKPIIPAPALTTTKNEPAGKIKHKSREQKREEEIAGQIPAGTPPVGISAEKQEAGKAKKPREEGTREEREYPSLQQIAGSQQVEAMSSGVAATATPIASVSPYAELHPEILSLFERMIGVMTVMKTAGITETTLVLSEKTFAGTVLSGTSIKISEYRFAAGELNLEFSGTPQAVALLQQHLPSLTAALSRAGLIVKRSDFIFSRKESPGGRGEEQKEREKQR